MKKTCTLFLFFLGLIYSVKADHITGGQMSYSFTGISNGMYQYSVSFKLFMRCNSGRQFNDPTIVSVFNRITNERIMDVTVQLSSSETISLNSDNPCITNPPTVCYVVGYYNFSLSLPASNDGYILASQVNYRIAGISNLISNYGLIGAAYTAEIPGTTSAENQSASFIGSDLVIVCADNSFSYSFAAHDGDGDMLRYSFCNAYQSMGGGGGGGGLGGGPGQNVPTGPPPYISVPYGSGFSSSSPLGKDVKIDPANGLISGVAPGPGIYVVTVCVDEIRNGAVIATQRKDLQINITSCSIASASLLPAYMLCRNSKTITIANRSTSPLIKTYNWELLTAAGTSIYTSTDVNLNYTFIDTGSYLVKLIINKGEDCSDSAVSVAKVYPGFIPDFNFRGICVNKPTVFTDATASVYGTVNSWSWEFGDNGIGDRSELQNPTYTFAGLGPKKVQLIVSNTLGCVDTIYKQVTILEKPVIDLAFRDTLICVRDQLQLVAQGNGIFSWSPAINLVNATSNTPTVSPSSTTVYYVQLDDNGCLNRDSVKVRVVDHVSLQAMPDTVICLNDAILLRLVSDGLQYSWTPVSQLQNPNSKNPTAITPATTTYEVTATIGGCSTKDQVLVTTVPYPVADAGPDTTICFNTAARLHGSVNGNSLVWSPASTLSNATVSDPRASPAVTTNYILAAYDIKGCPKPGYDTMIVKVLPKIRPSAGRDTSVVINQPLQLNATGGVKYLWVPATGLSSAGIANPIVTFAAATEKTRYKVLVYNEANCVDSAFISIKVFKTLPDIFVPNAFTPGNSINNVFRPIPVGVVRIDFFRIYNRLGQMVYSSTESGKGWDGTIAGKLQAPDTYVWMVQGKDYRGGVIFKKGTVTLIR